MKVRLSPEGPEVSRIALGWMRLRNRGLGTAGIRRRIEECAALGVEISREDWFGIWTASRGRDVP